MCEKSFRTAPASRPGRLAARQPRPRIHRRTTDAERPVQQHRPDVQDAADALRRRPIDVARAAAGVRDARPDDAAGRRRHHHRHRRRRDAGVEDRPGRRAGRPRDPLPPRRRLLHRVEELARAARRESREGGRRDGGPAPRVPARRPRPPIPAAVDDAPPRTTGSSHRATRRRRIASPASRPAAG